MVGVREMLAPEENPKTPTVSPHVECLGKL
jgi:hypothetical protein